MLSCFYIDNANYQENQIPRQNKKDGHEVMIIASTDVFNNNINEGRTKPCNYLNEDGITVIRLPYKKIFLKSISIKVRAYPKLYELINDFSPDVILFHGIAAYALLTVAKYKKEYPKIKFYVDNHADYHNTGTNFLSKHILHRFFYKPIIKKCLPYIDKIFYITYETLFFLKNEYHISEEYLQFFPLGGTIPQALERNKIRKRIRLALNISEEEILMIHSGRLVPEKRTIETLKAFKQVADMKFRLLIIGTMDKDISAIAMPLINSDSRINYLGWIKGELLKDYLCASDLYLQLGDQSATMQDALCSGCAAAIFPYKSHKYLLNDSVFYIETIDDLVKILKIISTDRSILEEKRRESFFIAENSLDYQKTTRIIYQ